MLKESLYFFLFILLLSLFVFWSIKANKYFQENLFVMKYLEEKVEIYQGKKRVFKKYESFERKEVRDKKNNDMKIKDLTKLTLY